MFKLAADPKRWMSVTAPVEASVRWNPACLIRNVAMTRWTICKTGASSWGETGTLPDLPRLGECDLVPELVCCVAIYVKI
jgi:hypothetical protein